MDLSYRRLIDPSQRQSLLHLYGKQTAVGKGMFKEKMAICDLPRPYPPDANYTFHRMVETMGSDKDIKSQRYRWFASMCSFGSWMRHPAMRNYGSEGLLMHQLRKYGAKLPQR